MNYQYYLFAFYIFVLICVIVFLSRYLFSDLKNQRKLLEEKESKLLRLYQTMEELMDEFYESVRESKAEIKEAASKAIESVTEDLPVSAAPVKEINNTGYAQAAANIRASGLVKTTQAYNKTALSQDGAEPPFNELFNTVSESAPDLRSMTRTEAILMLNKQGKNRSAIAQELNITLSEVDLVIGINKNGA